MEAIIASVLGGLVGGLFTFLGVWMTIHHENKKTRREERPAMQLEKISSVFCGKLFAKQDMSNISKDTTLLPLVAQPYVTKAKGWEHEQEYRLIYSENDLDKTTIFKKKCTDGIERYMYPAKTTKIFLGAAMPEDRKEEIRFISPKGIEIGEMKITETKYELIS